MKLTKQRVNGISAGFTKLRLTKYPQSCFVIESAGKKIMIDPGIFFAEKFKAADFLDVTAVLFTHQHIDHLDIASVKLFAANKIPIYGNADVAAKLSAENVKVNEVSGRKKFFVAGFEIEPVDLPHCQLRQCKVCKNKIWNQPSCKDHQNQVETLDGPQNTGFLVDGVFFHPGDGVEIENVIAKNAGVPIVGPTITYADAWLFAEQIKAKTVIPMHYDHLGFLNRDPNEFAKLVPKGIDVRILENGESTEL